MNDGIRKKAYGYTRVSTEEQVDGASLDNQRNAIQEYADKNNIEIIGWYTDAGLSAKNTNRPELNRMLDDMEANKSIVDYIIIYNVTRLTRDIPTFCRYIEWRLVAAGVALRSTQENFEDNPDGEMIMYVQMALGQRDNKSKARTVKENMSSLAKQGWWLSQAPIGLKLKRVYVGDITENGRRYHNTLEKDYKNDIGDKIAFLIRRFSEGDIGEADLVKLAQKMEILSINGDTLNINSIHRILTQTAYAGYNSSKKTLGGKIVKLRDFDGIIPMDIYNKNQRLLCGNKKDFIPSEDEMYPLKKTLICSKCGKTLRASAPLNGSGKRSPRYHCITKGHGSISNSSLHESFIAYLQNITPKEGTLKLFKEIIKRNAAKNLSDTNRDIKNCRNELSRIDDKLNKTIDAFLNGNISREEKDHFSKDLKIKRGQIEMTIDKYEKIQQLNEATIDYICNFATMPAKMWRNASLEARQAFQEILFPKGLHYDILEKKYGTDDLSPFYSVICDKNEPETDSNSRMVRPAGVEPVTPGTGNQCSIH